MDSPNGVAGWTSGLSSYFAFILGVATLGPLLFGFHLVSSVASLAGEHG